MEHSESIPTEKHFSKKFFWLCHVFTILVILAKKPSPTKKILRGKKFSISRFSVWNTFWDILNRFRPKTFLPKFFYFVIFSLLWSFWPKKTKSNEKNFRFRDFQFKIRFEISWIDSAQKNFRLKFFDFVIFSRFWSFWQKKTKSQEKNFTRVRNFDFQIFIFVLKYVSKYSESIPTKRFFFDQKPRFCCFWVKKISQIFFSPSF